MSRNEPGKRVLYVITCATSSASVVQDFVIMAQKAAWDVCVILTPRATNFVDVPYLEQLTGHPVRSNYKQPHDPDVLPRADAIVVYAATFNTINKWALGISDNLALGLLCEHTGLKTPLLAFPVVRKGGGLETHPAFYRSIAMLKSYGVHVLYEPDTYPPRNHIPAKVLLDALHQISS